MFLNYELLFYGITKSLKKFKKQANKQKIRHQIKLRWLQRVKCSQLVLKQQV